MSVTRDVLIKIAVESSSNNSGGAFKGIEEAASNAAKGVKALEDHLRAMQNAYSQIGKLDSDIAGAQKSRQDMWSTPTTPTAHTTTQQSRSGGTSGVPRIGMPGHAKSVGERGSQMKDDALNKIRQMPGGEGIDQLSPEHMAKLDQRLQRESEAIIKTQDRETQNALDAEERQAKAAEAKSDRKARAEEQAQKKADALRKKSEATSIKESTAAREAYNDSVRKAVYGSLELAKGLALVAASGDQANEALLRNIVSTIGYFNVIKGGLETFHHIQDAVSVAGATKGGIGGVGAGQAAAGGIAVAPGTASAAMNPWTAVAALAAATGLFVRQANIWQTEAEKRERSINVTHAEIVSRYAGQAAGRHVDSAIRLAESTPNVGEMIHTARVQRRKSANEFHIPILQAISGRSFEGKQEIRSRIETESNLKTQSETATNSLKHVQEQRASLVGVAEQFEKDKADSKEKYDALQKSLDKSKRVASDRKPEQPLIEGVINKSTAMSWALKGLQYTSPVGIAGGSFGFDLSKNAAPGSRLFSAITGTESDAAIGQHNKDIEKQKGEAAADRKNQENAEEEKGVQLKQKQVELGKQEVQGAADKLEALRAQTQFARQNLETDRERLAIQNRSVGAQSLGQQFILKQLEAKRLAGQSLEKWEVDRALANAPSGTKLHTFAMNQAEKMGAGILESEIDIVKDQKKLGAAQQQQNNEEPKLQQVIQEEGLKNAENAKEIVEAIRSINLGKETVAALEKAVEHVKEKFRDDLQLFLSMLR